MYKIDEIDVLELKNSLDTNRNFRIIDIRELSELNIGEPEDPPAVPPSSQLKHQWVLEPYQLQP